MVLAKSKTTFLKSKNAIGWRTGRGDIYLLCPFHKEKTPSCVIHVKTCKYFHCYGCGLSGLTKRLERKLNLKCRAEPIRDENQLEFDFVIDLSDIPF